MAQGTEAAQAKVQRSKDGNVTLELAGPGFLSPGDCGLRPGGRGALACFSGVRHRQGGLQLIFRPSRNEDCVGSWEVLGEAHLTCLPGVI